VFTFRLLSVATFFTEAHNTSRDGLEDYKSSGTASLRLDGHVPSRHSRIPGVFQAALQAAHAQLQADGLAMQQQVAMAGVQLVPIILFTGEGGVERWNNNQRRVHRDRFPLSDHLVSLMTIVQSDLTEQQRERLTSHLAIKGLPLRNYTFDLTRSAFLELFCAPRSSLDNPSFRPSSQQRTFFVHDYGELEGATGYWAIEEETGHEGFAQEFEDIFWIHAEV